VSTVPAIVTDWRDDEARTPAVAGAPSKPVPTGRLSVPVVAAAGIVIVFVVLFWQLGTPTFWDPDEAHYAQTTRELIARGDWWAPYFNEQLFFDKPILFHQLQAMAMLAFGQNEFAARLVPALAALALIALTAWLGATLVSIDVGVLAALLLATSPGVFALARYAILDTAFTAFLFAGAALVAVAAFRDRSRLQYAGYVLIAVAVLIKGPLALVICGLTFIIAVAVSAETRRRILSLHWIRGLALVLAIAAPWFIYMYGRFGAAFVSGYLLDENLKLFATKRFGHPPGAWFYFQILAAGLLPWTPVVIGRLVDDVRAVVAKRRLDGFEVLLWSWTAAVVGFFTLSQFKLDHYIFPAAPALCLLCARTWTDVRSAPDDSQHKCSLIGFRLVGPAVVAIGIGGGYFIIERLALPPLAAVVPIVMTCAGVRMTIQSNVLAVRRIPRVPWVALSAVTITYAGIVFWVMPALETRKVVPELARWVAASSQPTDRIASYRLNRWSTAFRFYVDRHTTMLETPGEARAFFETTEPFYCAMLEPAYQEFVAQGVPLKVVNEREGMWRTSGRALWRRNVPPTRFVIVTRAP
jgi:4-amino-4-deoxy-L-arabinose transferase-like glycosyltransferase